jgi:hypothetical protein
MSQDVLLGFRALDDLKSAVRLTFQQHKYCSWAATGECGCSAVAESCSELQDSMLKATASAGSAGTVSARSMTRSTDVNTLIFEMSKSLASAAAAVISGQHHCLVLEMITNTFQM